VSVVPGRQPVSGLDMRKGRQPVSGLDMRNENRLGFSDSLSLAEAVDSYTYDTFGRAATHTDQRITRRPSHEMEWGGSPR